MIENVPFCRLLELNLCQAEGMMLKDLLEGLGYHWDLLFFIMVVFGGIHKKNNHFGSR